MRRPGRRKTEPECHSNISPNICLWRLRRSLGCGVQILRLWRVPPGLQVGANAAELIPVGGCRAVFAGAVLVAAMR
jgi:hypothetical protein